MSDDLQIAGAVIGILVLVFLFWTGILPFKFRRRSDEPRSIALFKEGYRLAMDEARDVYATNKAVEARDQFVAGIAHPSPAAVVTPAPAPAAP